MTARLMWRGEQKGQRRAGGRPCHSLEAAVAVSSGSRKRQVVTGQARRDRGWEAAAPHRSHAARATRQAQRRRRRR